MQERDARTVDERLAGAVIEMEKSMRERKSVIGARDMVELVKCAVMHQEITLSRAAEIMGLTVREMRALSSLWLKGEVGTPELGDQ